MVLVSALPFAYLAFLPEGIAAAAAVFLSSCPQTENVSAVPS